MITFFTANIWLIWLLVSLLCLMIELTSGDLYLLCFAIGGLCASLATALGADWVVQVIVFAVSSLLCLFFVRPTALRWLHKGEDNRLSNADAIIGRTGVVSEDIPANGYGRVALDGDDWKAESEDGQPVDKGEQVKITGRESIILKVMKM